MCVESAGIYGTTRSYPSDVVRVHVHSAHCEPVQHADSQQLSVVKLRRLAQVSRQWTGTHSAVSGQRSEPHQQNAPYLCFFYLFFCQLLLFYAFFLKVV